MRELKYLSVREACTYLPGRPHTNSVRRWIQVGCYGIKLRSIRFGKKRLTAECWCDEFVEAVTAQLTAPLSKHYEAEAALDRLGV